MKIEIYTKSNCRYCVLAKDFLKRKNIEYTEYSIEEEEHLQSFKDRCGPTVKTVPQIFRNNERIGGYDDMMKVTHLFENITIEKINL